MPDNTSLHEGLFPFMNCVIFFVDRIIATRISIPIFVMILYLLFYKWLITLVPGQICNFLKSFNKWYDDIIRFT